ncbi:MAG: hypothetical protein ACFB10_16735 [Salibacteraceae bacterium]
MAISYNILFSLKQQNSHYQETQLADLNLRPTPPTQQKLHSGQMMWRTSGTNANLLVPVQNNADGVTQIAPYPVTDFDLYFFCDLTNTSFVNFTETTLPLPGTAFFFSNLRPDSSNAIELVPENSNWSTIYLSNYKVNYTFAEPIASDGSSMVVNDSWGNTVVNQTLQQGAQNATFDLTGPGEGWYAVIVNDETVGELFVTELNFQDRPFAVVQIANKLPDGNRLLISESRTLTPLNYQCSFTARATTWQYLVFDQSDSGYLPRMVNDKVVGKKNPKELDIVDESEDSVVTFTGISEMPNGDLGLTFESQSQLFLQARPQEKFRLISRTDKSTLIDPLPAANERDLKTSMQQNTINYISPIHIYV